MKYIVLGILGALFAGPFGIVIAIGICVFIDVKNHTQQNIESSSSANQHSASQHAALNLQDLTPIIDIFCIYALKHEQNWVSEKVKFIKNKFIDESSTREELIYLRDRLKLQNRPSLNKSVHDYLALQPNQENKQLTLETVACLLILTCDDFDVVYQDSLDLAERIGLSANRCRQIVQKMWDWAHAEPEPQATFEPKRLSELEQSALVLGVAVNANADEIQKAWRLKIKDFHPDRNVYVTDAVRKMIEEESRAINTARDVLLAAQRR